MARQTETKQEGSQWNPKKKGGRVRYESYKDQKKEQEEPARDKPGARKKHHRAPQGSQGLSPSKRTLSAACFLIGWFVPVTTSREL